MKYFIAVVFLMMFSLPLIAEDQSGSVVIYDFDHKQHGFSFAEGGLVDFNPREEGCPMNVDFIFDNVLGMNNKELARFFSGTGEIINLGMTELDVETPIPAEGFEMSVDIEDLNPGQVFFLKTADGLNYGKIQITSLSEEQDVLGFDWVSLD